MEADNYVMHMDIYLHNKSVKQIIKYNDTMYKKCTEIIKSIYGCGIISKIMIHKLNKFNFIAHDKNTSFNSLAENAYREMIFWCKLDIKKYKNK